MRDEDTGDLWSPTALPIRDEAATYIARHGRGYSRFEHTSTTSTLDLLQFVPLDDSIKISRLRLRNLSRRAAASQRHGLCGMGARPVARAAGAVHHHRDRSADRRDVRAQSLEHGLRLARRLRRSRRAPDGLDRRPPRIHRPQRHARRSGGTDSAAPLSNTVGAGLDPCGALQTKIELAPGGERRSRLLPRRGRRTRTRRAALIARYRSADLDAVLSRGRALLGRRSRRGPGRRRRTARWTSCSTAGCSIRRSPAGSGRDRPSIRRAAPMASAISFRTCMALAASRPQLTREHLLRAAARQFVEGDVQHWWLPHSGQGVRTRISDDRVWLAYRRRPLCRRHRRRRRSR